MVDAGDVHPHQRFVLSIFLDSDGGTARQVARELGDLALLNQYAQTKCYHSCISSTFKQEQATWLCGEEAFSMYASINWEAAGQGFRSYDEREQWSLFENGEALMESIVKQNESLGRSLVFDVVVVADVLPDPESALPLYGLLKRAAVFMGGLVEVAVPPSCSHLVDKWRVALEGRVTVSEMRGASSTPMLRRELLDPELCCRSVLRFCGEVGNVCDSPKEYPLEGVSLSYNRSCLGGESVKGFRSAELESILLASRMEELDVIGMIDANTVDPMYLTGLRWTVMCTSGDLYPRCDRFIQNWACDGRAKALVIRCPQRRLAASTKRSWDQFMEGSHAPIEALPRTNAHSPRRFLLLPGPSGQCTLVGMRGVGSFRGLLRAVSAAPPRIEGTESTHEFSLPVLSTEQLEDSCRDLANRRVTALVRGEDNVEVMRIPDECSVICDGAGTEGENKSEIEEDSTNDTAMSVLAKLNPKSPTPRKKHKSGPRLASSRKVKGDALGHWAARRAEEPNYKSESVSIGKICQWFTQDGEPKPSLPTADAHRGIRHRNQSELFFTYDCPDLESKRQSYRANEGDFSVRFHGVEYASHDCEDLEDELTRVVSKYATTNTSRNRNGYGSFFRRDASAQTPVQQPKRSGNMDASDAVRKVLNRTARADQTHLRTDQPSLKNSRRIRTQSDKTKSRPSEREKYMWKIIVKEMEKTYPALPKERLQQLQAKVYKVCKAQYKEEMATMKLDTLAEKFTRFAKISSKEILGVQKVIEFQATPASEAKPRQNIGQLAVTAPPQPDAAARSTRRSLQYPNPADMGDTSSA